MIPSLTVILVCQLVGEIITRGVGWPVPGPVIGTVLLLVLLAVRDWAPRQADGTLEATGRAILAHLSLLFVPAGVGVVQRLDLFVVHGVGVAVALVASTILTLLTTAAAFLLVWRWTGGQGGQAHE